MFMARHPASPDPDRSESTPHGSPPPGFLSALDAAERLGISLRHFKKRVAASPIDGAIAHGPSAKKYYPEGAIEDLIIEGADEEQQAAVAALMKQTAVSAREVFEAGNKALAAGVAAVAGVVPFLLTELERQGKALKDAQTDTLEALKLTRDLIIEQAKLEAERVKQEADQTLQIDRNKTMLEGVRTLAPVAKAAIARSLHMPELVRDAEGETVSKLVNSLDEKTRDELLEALDDETRDALTNVFGYADGKAHLKENLNVLRKLRENPALLQKLAPKLTTEQQAALMSIFAEKGDEEKKKAPKD